MKKLTPEQFDAHLRQRLESFEMPYDASAWSRFEAQLPAQQAPVSQTINWLKGLAAMAVVASVGIAAYYLWPQDNEADIAKVSVPLTDAQIIEKSNNGGAYINTGEEESSLFVKQHTGSPVGNTFQGKQSDELIAGPHHIGTSAVQTNRHTVVVEPVKNLSSPIAESDGNDLDRSTESESIHLRLIMSKTEACAGEEVSFMALTDKGGLQYRWSFSDGEETLSTEPARTFDSPGLYDVTLTATKGAQQWQRTATVEVRPEPEAKVEELKALSPRLPLFTVSTALQAGEVCRWNFSDGRVSTESETRQLFRYRGAAEVELTVTNSFGCTTTNRQSVRISEDFRLFAETGFTPDGDGTNDTFLPKALEVMNCGFEMTVRDLNGREVFRTSSVDESWNGREFNNGAQLPKGVYIWTVVLTDDVLKNPVFSSDITLR